VQEWRSAAVFFLKPEALSAAGRWSVQQLSCLLSGGFVLQLLELTHKQMAKVLHHLLKGHRCISWSQGAHRVWNDHALASIVWHSARWLQPASEAWCGSSLECLWHYSSFALWILPCYRYWALHQCLGLKNECCPASSTVRECKHRLWYWRLQCLKEESAVDITAESVWTNHNEQLAAESVCFSKIGVQLAAGFVCFSKISVQLAAESVCFSKLVCNHSRICFPKCAIAAESISQNQYSIIAESVCQFQYVICNSKLHLVSF